VKQLFTVWLIFSVVKYLVQAMNYKALNADYGNVDAIVINKADGDNIKILPN
jgi:hypothetical protein